MTAIVFLFFGVHLIMIGPWSLSDRLVRALLTYLFVDKENDKSRQIGDTKSLSFFLLNIASYFKLSDKDIRLFILAKCR